MSGHQDALPQQSEIPAGLRRQLIVVALVFAAAWLSIAGLFSAYWSRGASPRWMLISGVVLCYQWVFLWINAADNRRSVERPVLARFGPGMLVTVARGFLLGMLAGFLFTPRPEGFLGWVPAISYTSASILDYLDGYVARVYGDVTMLGERLDTELDAQGMLLASALAVWYGALPAWFLVIGLLRYGFQFGRWALRSLGKRARELPPSVSRRPIAGLTMGFLSAVLWPIFSPPETVVAGIIFALIILLSFGRDWLVVSGLVDSDGGGYTRARSAAKRLLSGWVPIAARAAMPILILPLARDHLSGFVAGEGGASTVGGSFPAWALLIFGIVDLSTLLFILIGAAPRISALLLMVPVGLSLSVTPVEDVWACRLVGILLILILGSGRFSLWQPEEEIFSRQAGSSDPGEG